MHMEITIKLKKIDKIWLLNHESKISLVLTNKGKIKRLKVKKPTNHHPYIIITAFPFFLFFNTLSGNEKYVSLQALLHKYL